MALAKVRESILLGGIKMRKINIAVTMCFALTGSMNAYALSIGEAKVQSHIGENLSVFVPVDDEGKTFNISEFSVLSANKEQKQALGIKSFGNNMPEINYQIIGNDGRQGILITTNVPVNEPYVNLAFQVNYNGDVRLKGLPILLDLPGLKAETQFPYSNTSLVSDNVSTASSTNNESGNVGAEYATYGSDIMGPYDWAQEGLVPEKFGPVLDGQSLWRVARRINKSMDVSVDQMMWALYKNNPNAFTSTSVGSLKAGVVLKIPSESMVREVSELQAIRLLSNDSGSASSASQTSESTENKELANTEQNDNSGSESADSASSFQIVQPDNISEFDKNLFATLRTKVEDLTEQLTKKDLEIQYLKTEQLKQKDMEIEYLKGVITENGIDVPDYNSSVSSTAAVIESTSDENVDLDLDGSLIENNEDITLKGVIPDNFAKDEGVLDVNPIELDSSVDSQDESLIDVNASPPELVAESKPEPKAQESGSFGIWPFILGALALLLGVLFILRDKLTGLFRRFMGDDDELVLNIPSVTTDTSNDALSTTTVSASPKEESSVPLREELPYEDDYIFDEGDVHVEEVNLSDRIRQLLRTGDFSAARKTVDFAAEAGIDPNYLDFCRLKIAAAEDDKPEFAKVFNKVNRRINDFQPDIQHRIAELHREMFDSETVIDFGFKED